MEGAGAERTGNVDGAVLTEKDVARLYVPANERYVRYVAGRSAQVVLIG